MLARLWAKTCGKKKSETETEELKPEDCDTDDAPPEKDSA